MYITAIMEASTVAPLPRRVVGCAIGIRTGAGTQHPLQLAHSVKQLRGAKPWSRNHGDGTGSRFQMIPKLLEQGPQGSRYQLSALHCGRPTSLLRTLRGLPSSRNPFPLILNSPNPLKMNISYIKEPISIGAVFLMMGLGVFSIRWK